MLKHVTGIMAAHVTSMAFPPTGHVKHYYCFILGRVVFDVVEYLFDIPYLESHT
jgi:hypothetical protein